MPSDTAAISSYAETVDEAARQAKAIPQFPEGTFNVDTAYQVQSESIARRLQRGELRSGIKMGFTSRAKMQQMGVHDLIWGRLTDAMMIPEGDTVGMGRFIHPRVEPEIAFILGEDLCGRVSIPEAMSCVEAVAPALEIIDSRYRDFKFSLADVVADNASSSGYVIGPWCAPEEDISNLGIVMHINGRARQCGSTAAILGHPCRSLVHAARLAELAGVPLQAGWVVLAGAATAAEPLQAGDQVTADFQNMGSVSFSATASL